MIWRAAVVGAIIAWALLCTFVFGGGFVVLGFLAVWYGVWFAFSLFGRWADDTRRDLLRRRGYY